MDKFCLIKKYKKLIIIFISIFLFTIIYWLLGSSDNLSFNIKSTNNKPHQTNLSFIDALYFAMETQSTIGYGDITPKSQLMRCITICQITLLIIIIFY